MDSSILQKLALERCRVHLSQVCAIMHLAHSYSDNHQDIPNSLHGLFETLNRDLQILEDLVEGDI